MAACIYKILNTINGKFYIGSTKDFKARKNSHISYLNRNKGVNKYIQKSWNKHGEKAFDFEILMICPIEYLLKLEQWFINNLKPEYNSRIIATSNIGIKHGPRSKQTNLKQRETIRKYNDQTIKEIILLRNKNKTYKEISKILKVNIGSISKIVNGRSWSDKTNISKPKNIKIETRKLSKEIVKEIYTRANRGENQYKLASLYNVNQTTISNIKNLKRNYTWAAN